MSEGPVSRRDFLSRLRKKVKGGTAWALDIHGKVNPVDLAIKKMAERVPSPLIPLMDEFSDFIGQVSLSLTAPNANVKAGLWVPKSLATAASTISIFRGYFAQIYPVIMTDIQDGVEKRWGIREAGLDDLVKTGERLKKFPKDADTRFDPKDLFAYWMEGYFYKKYSAHNPEDVEPDRILDICEGHFLATHLRDRGDFEGANEIMLSSEFKEVVKAYQFACDHSLKIRGGLEACNGAIFLVGGTTIVEKVKGAILSVGALQLSASPSSVDRYRNPMDVSADEISRRNLLHRSAYVASHGLIEHLLERRSIDLCFNSMNVLNLADLAFSYRQLKKTTNTTKGSEKKLELLGKSLAYGFFTMSNQLALQTDIANREQVEFMRSGMSQNGLG